MPDGQPTGRELIDLKNRIVNGFNASHWRELGTLTDTYEMVTHHPRLLRSLNWNDDDYEGHALDVIRRIIDADSNNYQLLIEFVARVCPAEDEFVTSPDGKLISFKTDRKYRIVRELGRGGCGLTVLVHDDLIDEQFVCKKYQPSDESLREELFAAFVREIKLLHKLHHPNVVRVFNYYLYSDQFAGFIFMEFVDGTDIQDHLAHHPEKASELFRNAISGFQYLENAGILHRDIRPRNLMVSHDGILKVIDLGFGKRISGSADFEKSISLNWWCEPPNDFDDARYDFATEVYFVGKLFQRIIEDNNIENFHYMEALRAMCERSPERRIQSFSAIEQSIRSEQFSEMTFASHELTAYRNFAESLWGALSKIEHGAKYYGDVDRIESDLSKAYRSFMLEEFVPDPVKIARCFIDGTYYYKKNSRVAVTVVKHFLELLRKCSGESARIVVANLHTKLDTVERYYRSADDVPF